MSAPAKDLRKDPDHTTIKARYVNETNKSTLFDCEGDEVWIPKSICQVNEDETITIPDWFYKKNFK